MEEKQESLTPKFSAGDWVITTEDIQYKGLSYTPGEQWGSEYITVDKGQIGRINKITDENRVLFTDKTDPDIFYRFDKGSAELLNLGVRESKLELLTYNDVSILRSKKRSCEKALNELNPLIKDIVDDIPKYGEDYSSRYARIPKMRIGLKY